MKPSEALTIDTGHPSDVFKGLLCTWLHQPRGGYGYQIPVYAEVLSYRKTTQTVTIRVRTKSGARVTRTVPLTSLRGGKP